MCVEHRNLKWPLMLLLLIGALCRPWKVEYKQQHICAEKGSSVVILCSFYYPGERRVNRVLWGHRKHDIYNGPFIFDSKMTNNSSKFQYIGDKQHNCSLKIRKVEHNDAGEYAFRFMTNNDEKWTGTGGPTLKVVDLNIVMSKANVNGRLREGDSVNLTCVNGCDGGHLPSVFSWFKNREPLKEGPVLYLSNITTTNSGNYTCSLKMHTGTSSAVMIIDVEYGPKNTSVSVSPSMEVYAGSNIILTCSSQANPPVENYTWFKINENDDIMAVGHQPVFFSGDGGQFLCRATNKHGSQKSSFVTVKIKEYWTTFIKAALIINTVTVLLIVAAVIAVIRLKRKRTRAPETDSKEDIQNTDYVNWPFDHSQSQERNHCDGATAEIVYATVDFHTQRRTNLEQQMDSTHDDESVIYSTVCRHQPLNPSYIETLNTMS